MTRKLWSIENEYTIFKEGKKIGFILFEKHYDGDNGFKSRVWTVKNTSLGYPFTCPNYSAEWAMRG